MGETQLTQSPHSTSLSWLSGRLEGGVAFCKEKGELLSAGCCGGFLIIFMSWNDGIPGVLSKGDLGPVHCHCLVHSLSYKLSVEGSPVCGPDAVELDWGWGQQVGYCLIQCLGQLIQLLIKS